MLCTSPVYRWPTNAQTDSATTSHTVRYGTVHGKTTKANNFSHRQQRNAAFDRVINYYYFFNNAAVDIDTILSYPILSTLMLLKKRDGPRIDSFYLIIQITTSTLLLYRRAKKQQQAESSESGGWFGSSWGKGPEPEPEPNNGCFGW